MTRTFLAALALAAAAVQPAFAGGDSTYAGGCGIAGVSDITAESPDEFTVAIYSRTVVYSPTANPVSATVTCTIEVDGATVVSVPFSGTVVVAGWQLVRFHAAYDAVVRTCETVDYADATPTVTACPEPIELFDDLPPLECPGSCIPWWDGPDEVICPVLQTLDPYDVPGVVEVDEQGDVTLAGELFWDCPPYEVWSANTRS
jgi:hypothetical protein